VFSYLNPTIQVIVASMHQRKVEMAKRSCGFIGLPGGFGTFEEAGVQIKGLDLRLHVHS